MAPGLDNRIAAGEDPFSDAALARRSAELVSARARRRVSRGLERVLDGRREAGFSAAVACDREAVRIARPALEQLVAALRSRRSVRPQGVALAELLLTEPDSPLYRPAHDSDLYEQARAALFALGHETAHSERPELAL